MKYEIVRVISRGRKGRNSTAEVIVKLEDGRHITRHLVNGQGRHPEDSMPSQHRNARERVEEIESAMRYNEGRQQTLREALADPPAQFLERVAKQMLKQLEAEHVDLLQLHTAAAALRDKITSENPLMLRYE